MNAMDWQHIVRDHAPIVSRTASRLLAHHADAADCFQETFVSAWEFAQRQPVRNWPGLLQRLATTRALDQLRRRRAHRFDPIESSDLPTSQRGPATQAQDLELAHQLRRALADLPARLSECYCLRHLNDMSYEQIADELKISVSSVGVNLHRATERLRAALTPLVFDDHIRGET